LRKWVTGRGAARTLAMAPNGRSLAVTNELGSAQVWELATLKQRRFFQSDKKGWTWGVAFAPDGRSIATGGDDLVVRLWDLTDGSAQQGPLTDKDLEAYRKDLSDADAARAYTAIWTLAFHARVSVPFLTKRLQAEKSLQLDTKRIALLIQQLGDKLFSVRENASKELSQLGFRAREHLEQALHDKPSLEQRRRIDKLLEQLALVPFSPEEMLRVRVTETLETVGHAEVRRILEEAAKTQVKK